MISAWLLALSLLGRLTHPFGLPQQTVQVYSQGGWLIGIERDRFTSQLRCQLQTPRRGRLEIVYAEGALRFRFPETVNTLQAWYWVDEGPPRRWQDLYPALVEGGVSLDGPSLDNPTGGVVTLPRAEVEDARRVTIRVSSRAQPRTFKIRGFKDAFQAALRQGCSDTSFVR